MSKLACALLVSTVLWGQQDFLNHNRPMLDAHNCYPYEGKFADRIERALKTGFPVAIEQDMAWYGGRAVVSHTAKTTGSEPTLREHFFERVRPIIEKALKDNDRAHWPLIVLHFDFKSNEPVLLKAVWQVLGEYEGWITTATKTADPNELAAFDPKPLLVLTEDSDAQEEVFFHAVPVGAKLRLFGSAHTNALPAKTQEERIHLLATAAPEQLLSERPSNYRRWWNNSWYEVEEGGQPKAGDWTAADNQRLRALVDHAHRLGFWIRFYTLDGFAPADDQGWGNAYNFGSGQAVRLRWRAALEAGVDLIASDQYEELAAFMKQQAAAERARTEYPKNHPPRESTGLVPLPDLGTANYQGEEGGLYPGGGNSPPENYLRQGLAAAKRIVARDREGKPASDGKIAMVSTGMSNTTMESQAFLRELRGAAGVNPRFIFVDCAQGSQTAIVTANPASNYWKVAAERLDAAGVTAQQVQVAWVKQANAMPQGDFRNEANRLKQDLAATVKNLRDNYPNLQIVYLSSRIYAGYAAVPLNPEPYAYEGAFAVKWLIADRMKEPAERPWVAWGPYLWANGTEGRKQDGLVYTRDDLAADGTHPSASGQRKVARLLLEFLKNDVTAKGWFLAGGG